VATAGAVAVVSPTSGPVSLRSQPESAIPEKNSPASPAAILALRIVILLPDHGAVWCRSPCGGQNLAGLPLLATSHCLQRLRLQRSKSGERSAIDPAMQWSMRFKSQLEDAFVSIADQLKPTADNVLGTLDGLLAKAAENGGDALLAERLAPDMLPLAAQVRIASDQISAALKRTSDSAFVLPDDDDTTLAAARERVANTRAALLAQSESSFVAPEATIELSLPNGMAFAMRADEYVRDWALAQLYFHAVTAYAILRAKGLAIGKADFLPYMARYAKAPAPA
jgi:hypothetical protein